MGKIGPGTQSFVPLLENVFKIFALTLEKIDPKGIREKLNKFKILIIPAGWTEKYVSTLSKIVPILKLKISSQEKGNTLGFAPVSILLQKSVFVLKEEKK